MKKALYSIVLNEDVVREIDILAHKSGTNRSSLINKILAEYVNYVTPEQRICEILSEVERLTSASRELVPFFSPNSLSMSLKSSLEYKYRPTVKYEVDLNRASDGSLGTLSVVFRTQSEYLIARMTEFFKLWKRIEDAYLAQIIGHTASYALYDGKLVRSVLMPDGVTGAEELAKAITDYVELFDMLMKGYLSERLDDNDINRAYCEYISGTKIYI